MSRPLRIEYANAFYHVMNRGAGRRAIFNTKEEHELFLTLLSEAHSQYNIEVHAYCLMRNHYHLLIKTPMANLSSAMRHINGIYTQGYNRLNRTDGPLFRGRYKAILIDSDAYLIHLSKYIHLNPHEAGMVQSLSEYKWSSYNAFIGLSESPNWLFKEEIYGQLNKLSNHAENYKLFVEKIGQDEKMIEFYSKERIDPVLGRDAFKQKLPTLNQSIEIPRIDRLINRPSIICIIENTSKEFCVSEDSILYPKKGRGLVNTARKVTMYIAHKKYGYLLSEIALALQIKHYGGVANAISSINEKIAKMPEILIQINSIIKRLDP